MPPRDGEGVVLRASGKRFRRRYNPDDWASSILTVRHNVLCLGMSYPCVEKVIADHSGGGGAGKAGSGRKNRKRRRVEVFHSCPSVERSVELVRRNLLTQIDGRDLARIAALEAENTVSAYTVSKEQGSTHYARRHLDCDFNGRTLTEQMRARWGTKVRFRQVALDYFWSPSGSWAAQHWRRSFFAENLPRFVKEGLLHFGDLEDDVVSVPASRVTAKGGGGASEGYVTSVAAVVYLPFCLHCLSQVVACYDVLARFYTLAFLRKDELGEHALWSATNTISPDTMQQFLAKSIDQEEIYCTVDVRQIRDAGEGDGYVTKEQVLEVFDRIDRSDEVRMIKLTALRKFHPEYSKSYLQRAKPTLGVTKGGYVGLKRRRCASRKEGDADRSAIVAKRRLPRRPNEQLDQERKLDPGHPKSDLRGAKPSLDANKGERVPLQNTRPALRSCAVGIDVGRNIPPTIATITTPNAPDSSTEATGAEGDDGGKVQGAYEDKGEEIGDAMDADLINGQKGEDKEMAIAPAVGAVFAAIPVGADFAAIPAAAAATVDFLTAEAGEEGEERTTKEMMAMWGGHVGVEGSVGLGGAAEGGQDMDDLDPLTRVAGKPTALLNRETLRSMHEQDHVTIVRGWKEEAARRDDECEGLKAEMERLEGGAIEKDMERESARASMSEEPAKEVQEARGATERGDQIEPEPDCLRANISGSTKRNEESHALLTSMSAEHAEAPSLRLQAAQGHNAYLEGESGDKNHPVSSSKQSHVFVEMKALPIELTAAQSSLERTEQDLNCFHKAAERSSHKRDRLQQKLYEREVVVVERREKEGDANEAEIIAEGHLPQKPSSQAKTTGVRRKQIGTAPEKSSLLTQHLDEHVNMNASKKRTKRDIASRVGRLSKCPSLPQKEPCGIALTGIASERDGILASFELDCNKQVSFGVDDPSIDNPISKRRGPELKSAAFQKLSSPEDNLAHAEQAGPEQMTILQEKYEANPNVNDVLLGANQWHRPGNRQFFKALSLCGHDFSLVGGCFVDALKALDPPGRFMGYDSATGAWACVDYNMGLILVPDILDDYMLNDTNATSPLEERSPAFLSNVQRIFDAKLKGQDNVICGHSDKSIFPGDRVIEELLCHRINLQPNCESDARSGTEAHCEELIARIDGHSAAMSIAETSPYERNSGQEVLSAEPNDQGVTVGGAACINLGHTMSQGLLLRGKGSWDATEGGKEHEGSPAVPPPSKGTTVVASLESEIVSLIRKNYKRRIALSKLGHEYQRRYGRSLNWGSLRDKLKSLDQVSLEKHGHCWYAVLSRREGKAMEANKVDGVGTNQTTKRIAADVNLIKLSPHQASVTKYPPGCRVAYSYEKKGVNESRIRIGLVRTVWISHPSVFNYEIETFRADEDKLGRRTFVEGLLAYAPGVRVRFRPDPLSTKWIEGTVLEPTRNVKDDGAAELRYSVRMLEASNEGVECVVRHDVAPELLSFCPTVGTTAKNMDWGTKRKSNSPRSTPQAGKLRQKSLKND